ncbi:hypothetical protein TSMEX_008283 [Taenia solium]|eukprot:TsM_000594800 transcript=TsM_000594800 gene=TsM_000594800
MAILVLLSVGLQAVPLEKKDEMKWEVPPEEGELDDNTGLDGDAVDDEYASDKNGAGKCDVSGSDGCDRDEGENDDRCGRDDDDEDGGGQRNGRGEDRRCVRGDECARNDSDNKDEGIDDVDDNEGGRHQRKGRGGGCGDDEDQDDNDANEDVEDTLWCLLHKITRDGWKDILRQHCRRYAYDDCCNCGDGPFNLV